MTEKINEMSYENLTYLLKVTYEMKKRVTLMNSKSKRKLNKE